MQTILYGIWLLLPITYFGIALWSKLEEAGGSTKRENVGDLLRQGFFVLGCVGLAIAIDQYLLKDLVEMFSPTFIPLGLYQILLLPFILYIGAFIVGGSKDIRITKAPRVSQRKSRK
jgi:hypothetical protein